jgi:hypothetical protein
MRQRVVGEAGLLVGKIIIKSMTNESEAGKKQGPNPLLNPLLLLDSSFWVQGQQPLALPAPNSEGLASLGPAISSPLENGSNKTAPQGASILKGAR